MTSPALQWTLAILGAYMLGSVPFGFLIARARGIDIRQHGSRNIGATNVGRVLGRRWGALCFALDTLKGAAAVALAGWWTGALGEAHAPAPEAWLWLGVAIAAVAGHMFTIFLRFKGGKGVATSLGVIIGMMPLVSLIIFAVWGVVLKLTRYVSLASLIAAASLPVATLALMFVGPSEGWAAVRGWGYFYFGVLAAILVVKRHVPNIKRLMAGTELRFGDPKPTPEPTTSEPPSNA